MLHGKRHLQFTSTLKEVGKLNENSVSRLKSAQRGRVKLRRPPWMRRAAQHRLRTAGLGRAGRRRCMHVDDVSCAEDRAKVLPGRGESQVEAYDVHIRPGLVTMKVNSERLNSVVFKRSRQET